VKRLHIIWLGVLVAALYGLVPRHADLRGFHPKEMARLETQMWRCYYARNYAGLSWYLYRTCRDEYGFSPADSVRLMALAARAAKLFQDSKNETESSRARPDLEQYYTLIRHRSGMTFNVARAAELELRWWQMRRQLASPGEYGRTITELMGEIYQRRNADLQNAGQLRAQAMAYCDKQGHGKMRDADWQQVEVLLSEAYRLYHQGIHL
jgi:predicted DNA-binding ribbon-helix-helix protein